MTLALEWTPDSHPRWPKGTPHAGHIAAGEFMRIGDLLAKLSSQPSGTQDLSFLARGSDRISQVIARRADDPTRLNFDVHMRDGSTHEIGAGISTDFGEVMSALQHLDRGGVAPGTEPQPGAAVARVQQAAAAAPQPPHVPEAPVTAHIRPFTPMESRGTPGRDPRSASKMGAIATVHHADGSVTRSSHPNVAAAEQHVQNTHGVPADKIARDGYTVNGATPLVGKEPGPREQLKKGLVVHTPKGQGIVTRSGAGYATVKHDQGGTHDFANTDLRVPGGTPGATRADQQGRAAAKPGVVARVKPAKPKYSKQIDDLLAQANADKSINEWPVKPGPKADGIIPHDVIIHPQRDTIGATVLMHTVEGPGGQRVFTPERQKLHDRIVAQHLEGHKPQKKKVALFYAGGSASGKSSATKHLGDQFQEPADAVHIDPDAIKTMLPEYQALVNVGDRSPSSMTHEESSLLAKRIQAEAVKKGLNIILDGTGDSSGKKFMQKVEQVHGQGYEPHVFMVDAPTDVAIARAYKRGLDKGRFIPPSVIRELHSKVILSHSVWRDSPLIKSWQAWSTFDPANPDARTASKMAEGGAGKYNVLDPKMYKAMMQKMAEQETASLK